MTEHTIDSVEALTEVLGEPNDVVKMKVVSELDEEMQDFIASSTLVMISTLDAQGFPDVSPKGDPAGFVSVHSPTQIDIPDRPGNKLAYGFRNLIENPSIGLLFVTPNARETLRVKGRAVISRDPDLLQDMTVNNKPALLVTRIEIQECFFHCGKAMIRSRLWKSETWPQKDPAILARQFARKLEIDKEVMQGELDKNYEETLY